MRRLSTSQLVPLPFPAASAAPEGPRLAAASLRSQMRKLWEDRVTFITLFHTAVLRGGNDTVELAQQLLRNQDDIGNAMKPFYGEAVGNKLSSLLRDQFLIAARLVRAAKAGDGTDYERATRQWQVNADHLAAFLGSENPHWSGETLEMLRSHLAMTTDAVVSRLHHDTVEGDAAYHTRHEQMLRVADGLSSGIVEHFPARFGA
jgi:hypothetical protein